ncbi:ankyrin repeat-containing protein At5g02620-like isoform X3 [Rhododendron vialii]|uniref:ankyrin repeat-containing protein At5g02620-like isoform X3 n=1 Tax=Rhododendron vialii TaxID=182163 RepID=UPI00265F7D41|nr:ankyrin repeat-containing protein At5g02620-like isoform X3 [Rhododendron vialii]
MAERLNEAEINENPTSLHDENEYNLDRAMVKCFNWTPLHVAASRGQQELFQELLHRNPELAKALDSQQQSLLHLASANGHIEIVKALTQVRPEMCLARDRDGANPLHVAAMRGKVEVLDELFKANPHAARARVESGERETILHICVKYNQLPFLSKLLENYFKGKEFVNAKDNADNTILHVAVEDRRYEIIKYVLSHTKIDTNAINASKQTAMDILLFGQKKGTEPERVDKDIHALLREYRAKGVEDGILIDPMQRAEKRNGIVVATVLMATLAFQVGVAPPGGVWQDEKDGPHGHKSGEAVMASNYPVLYEFFRFFNIFGFTASLCTLVLVMTDLPFKTGRYSLLTSLTKGATISSIAMAYLISLFVVSPVPNLESGRHRHVHSLVGAILTLFFSALGALLLFLIARIVVMKKRRNWAAASLTNPASVNDANV